MEIDWKAIFAHPLMNMLFGALIGYIPMHIKDKRELAAKERLAAEERKSAAAESRQAKAYEERRSAYVDFLNALQAADADSSNPECNFKSMHILKLKLGVLHLFCSATVFGAASLGVNTFRAYLLKTKETSQHQHVEYTAYLGAYEALVSAMRQDLAVHGTELC